MSIEAVAWALRQEVTDPVAKLILIALADHHNASTGECFPSRAALCQVACCGETALKYRLQKLIKAGWIKVEPRHTPSGRQTSNKYTICALSNHADAPEKAAGGGVSTRPLGGVSTRPLEGSPIDPSRGRAARPPTSLNRKNELRGAQAREIEFGLGRGAGGGAAPNCEHGFQLTSCSVCRKRARRAAEVLQ